MDEIEKDSWQSKNIFSESVALQCGDTVGWLGIKQICKGTKNGYEWE